MGVGHEVDGRVIGAPTGRCVPFHPVRSGVPRWELSSLVGHRTFSVTSLTSTGGEPSGCRRSAPRCCACGGLRVPPGFRDIASSTDIFDPEVGIPAEWGSRQGAAIECQAPLYQVIWQAIILHEGRGERVASISRRAQRTEGPPKLGGDHGDKASVTCGLSGRGAGRSCRGLCGTVSRCSAPDAVEFHCARPEFSHGRAGTHRF